MTWLEFTVLTLAAFRLALLISVDTGPFYVFKRFRAYLSRKARTEPAVAKSKVHEGVQCLKCSSIWVTMPLAAYALHHKSLPQWITALGDWMILFCALSAGAILWNRVPEKK